jgi:cell division protein FtsB
LRTGGRNLKKAKNSFQVANERRPVTVKRKMVKPKRKSDYPLWFPLILVCLLLGMIAVAVNMRAYADLKSQDEQHDELLGEFEKITEENLALEAEIKNLKSDPATIEREARRIGMSRPNEKILVPKN